MTEKQKQKLKTAFHEASHATVAFVLKKTFSSVTARREGELLGHVRFLKSFALIKKVSDLEKHLLISIAGPLGEDLLTSQERRWFSLQMETSLLLLDPLTPPIGDIACKTDVEQASVFIKEICLRPLHPKNISESAILWAAFDQVRNLLSDPDIRDAIQLLASNLYERKGKIKSQEARSIIRQHVPDKNRDRLVHASLEITKSTEGRYGVRFPTLRPTSQLERLKLYQWLIENGSSQ